MPQDTYTARVIALRKTKLGESDLVITMLAHNGAQIRAVAKGARKPTSSFSARLELCSECDVLLARGRSLDIVKEARIVASHDAVRQRFESMACAECMMELLDRATQVALENPTLFAMTSKALAALDTAGSRAAFSLCVAHLLKTFALCGVRPELSRCVSCGADLASAGDASDRRTWFSFEEGGVLCGECARGSNADRLEPALAGWLEFLVRSTFERVVEEPLPQDLLRSAFAFCRGWAHVHLGASLKSIGFLASSGIL